MKQCERCLKLTDGVHTCTPTPFVRGLEAQVKSLWQPIETAPKIGDFEFLGWNGKIIDKVWIGWFEDEKPVYVHNDYIGFNPTHWMKLPEPPEDTK